MKYYNKLTTALILGAGFGSRLKPITDSTPKILVEVAGIPMLDRIITQLKNTGIKRVVINTHYLHEKVENYIKKIKDIEIILSYEPVILGTGGGVLQAMELANTEELLIINCDCLLYSNKENKPFKQLLSKWNPEKMSMLALLHNKSDLPYPLEKGDFNLDENNSLIYQTILPKQYIFLGCYVISKDVFKGMKIAYFPITDIFHKPSADLLPFVGIVNKYKWFDTGNLKCLEVANSFFNEHKDA